MRGLQLGEHVLLELVVGQQPLLVNAGVGVRAEGGQLEACVVHRLPEAGRETVGQPRESLDALEADDFQAGAEVPLAGDADEVPEGVLPGVEDRREAVQRDAELRAGRDGGHAASSLAGIVLE